MNTSKFIRLFGYSLGVFVKISLVMFVFAAVPSLYILGFAHGYKFGQFRTDLEYKSLLSEVTTSVEIVNESQTDESSSSQEKVVITNGSLIKNVSWGGPDLWEAVNKRRVENGVNPLSSAENLCTIASLRLNELLELGKLDGHEGFGNLQERRPDLVWIFQNYSTVAEFLVAGADTADQAVSLWENTLGHKQLLTGGEYVWGCIYAQNSFAVAITAY